MASSSRPLTRGAACLPCRKLKAKCDGNKPACGRCLANNRPDDCEYAVGGEVTRSRLLEENIALLESRIKELENPSDAPSVRLHDPRRQSSTAAGSARHALPETQSLQLYPLVPTSSNSAVSAPSPQEIQILLQIFIAHASQLRFFLNPTRFVQAINLPHGDRGPTCEGLINTVYLWGSRLSGSSALRAREADFCAKAVQTSSGTSLLAQSVAPDSGVLYRIQSEVLLALYFMSSGRALEAKYHSVAAVALAMGSKYHQLDALGLARAGVDPVSIGEKIHAFWTVFAMDKGCASMMNTSPSICQRGRARVVITTPWPLPIEAYEQGAVIPRRGYNYSVEDFVDGRVDDSTEEFSRLALHVKAASLCERVTYLSLAYRPDSPNAAEFLSQFATLDNVIERFHRQIAAIQNRSPDDMREVLVCRTHACVAAIRLHSLFAPHQSASRQKCLTVAIASARALDVIDLNQYRHLDPIVAEMWSTICKVLIEEVRRLRAGAIPVRQEDMARIVNSLDRIMGAMVILSPTNPLMASNLSQLQQLKASISL
ncbi:hypothetical protein PYCCODRAFT_1463240 [Trametes coccinea BRFM310]|uniref:Zn(2)-C6 fungal-type domain-containing protein n=1 Tax=Trametes coccinea (strain BRFM310) TaxID=1353009 RepID=A0A1Y2J3J0_TRAC3|nr:hypothetical protein PYCCODRAFT_1463240 [Trametes coccinea BRFM310]